VNVDGVWTLYRGQERLADLTVVEADFPWVTARVTAHPGLVELLPLFAAELRLTDADDYDDNAWEVVYRQLRDAVQLRYPDGNEVPEFLLHLDGETAWWRWSDEPFDG